MKKATLVYDLSESARACIATRNAVTASPCPHGSVWQCSKAIERYAFIVGSKAAAAAMGAAVLGDEDAGPPCPPAQSVVCPRCGINWGDAPPSTFADGSCDGCRGVSDRDLLASTIKARDYWCSAYGALVKTVPAPRGA